MEVNEQRVRKRSGIELGIMAAIFVFFFYIVVSLIPVAPPDLETNFCPQAETIIPDASFANSSKFFEKSYRDFSVDKLSKAIQIPTVSYDDMGDPEEDDRFNVFFEFQKYVEKEFPRSVKHGKLEIVNRHGLLFTFLGTNTNLRPVLLMAHQDVVPPGTQNWTHSPFSGHFDGEFIHGRGAADTKNTLVAILEATESLLEQGWQPKRELILSFGFDEEVSGHRGASHLSQELLSRYGRDSLEVIVDEGFGFLEAFGSTIAPASVAEKGYLDVAVTLDTKGGHSSMPPDHTGIGIIAELAKLLEDNPFRPSVEDNNPTLKMFQCMAEHSKHMNKEYRRIVLDINHSDHREKFIDMLRLKPELLYTIRTSQALDVIQGGVKINALPEQVTLSINHRIAIDSSAAAILDRIEDLALRVAEKHQLGLYTDGDEVVVGPNGNFSITALSRREPSPISPSDGLPWKWISGTYRHVLEESVDDPADSVVMSPSLFPATTDTYYYWPLTRAIYRMSPVYFEDMIGYHAVNEKLRFRSHLISVAWFYEFIINSTV